jgi:hypothetical protein
MHSLKKFLIQRVYDIIGFFLTILGLSFSSRQCKNFMKQNSDKPIDIIIVPGIPYNGKKWDMIMKGRIYWAKYLFDKGITKNIIFSGAAVHSQWVESKIMALYAEAIGVPPEHIFSEEKAEHSTENVVFSYNQALEMGFSSVALASDPFQSKLLRKYINKFVSYEMTLLPIVYDILRKMDSSMIDPKIDADKALVAEFIPLKERVTFCQRFKGTRGKNIIV